ncbi:rRNA-processing protein FCF2 [Myriangium duriaei CBS 260.36]|uniref:rRNA-processing protein FCF2 n=1 Tax=Myriangium duriaei CBS 260.36 TaxID=1168546 RepID=A0A9P4MIM6_9PEZI|nr:rRNA-processing protein FCF2 [Myriangium duriaei CBS 260.36]
MPEDEALTDEQMVAMLQNAETRLRQKEQESGSSRDELKSFNFPKLSTGEIAKSHVRTVQHGAVKLREQDQVQEKSSQGMRKVEDPVTVRKRLAENKKASAGERWYNLPKTDLTPELKRDLQIMKMRNVLDPHRHYKKEGGKMKAPEFSQVGTIIEGPTEYYSARINNKDRKRTFVEEVLAGEQETGRFKRKYGDVQAKKTSGKKAFYNALKAKRSASYKKR